MALEHCNITFINWRRNFDTILAMSLLLYVGSPSVHLGKNYCGNSTVYLTNMVEGFGIELYQCFLFFLVSTYYQIYLSFTESHFNEIRQTIICENFAWDHFILLSQSVFTHRKIRLLQVFHIMIINLIMCWMESSWYHQMRCWTEDSKCIQLNRNC